MNAALASIERQGWADAHATQEVAVTGMMRW